jgi:acetoin utilization protein AcuB
MLVNEWMSTGLITISPDASLSQAAGLMKKHGIRRLPVVDQSGLLQGILSDRDLKEASPSKATTLDAHERYYLFNELTVGACMTKKVITVSKNDTVERAAVLMLENKISGLPVMDNGHPVGVLTLDDVARVLTVITGAYRGGTQFAFNLEDRPGSIKEVVDVVRKHGGRLVSLLSVYENADEGARKVFLRVAEMPEPRLKTLIQDLERDFTLLYMERDGRAQF